MLIIALVLAVIGLAALVFAVVTSNAVVAWVCIGASLLGVLLLTADAVRDRRRRAGSTAEDEHPDISDADADEELDDGGLDDGGLDDDDLADSDAAEDVTDSDDGADLEDGTADSDAAGTVSTDSAETDSAETDADETDGDK
ncbi:hypothetical protein ABQE69_08675 [Mycolicibacillus trivialis]|uniref:Transmembrane protein n=1 Tax=Mycolicibacillus trivialis TaxID=1798 RepID=A0A1X2ER07_9MYCO|nr:hypothetical protein [Mycolicibacillus trivialis]ORX08681.1 hypothetical protein AWC30_01350 [Mycolicibacillus trivialis]